MGMRRALCIGIAAGLLVTVLIGAGRSAGSSTTAAGARDGSFLGPAGGGHGWMPSRSAFRSVVWAVGDGADTGLEGKAVAAMIAARRVDRFLYLGDVYKSGTEAEFASNYRPVFGGFDRIAAPTIGNHEWPNVEAGYLDYWAGVRGKPPPFWYAFAVSGWQLISLNSNLPSGAGSPQLGWLRRKLAASPAYGSCRIAFMHHPRFSAGPHGDTPELDGVLEALSGDARILLAGHDHAMERLLPVDGITQLVEGAGGNELSPVNRADPRLLFADNTHHGALRLKLRPGRAVLSFVAEDGALLDRSSVGCKQG